MSTHFKKDQITYYKYVQFNVFLLYQYLSKVRRKGKKKRREGGREGRKERRREGKKERRKKKKNREGLKILFPSFALQRD